MTTRPVDLCVLLAGGLKPSPLAAAAGCSVLDLTDAALVALVVNVGAYGTEIIRAGVASVRISRRLPPTGSPWAMTVGSQVTFHPELRCRAVPDVADSNERSLSHRQVVFRLNDAVPSLYSSGLSTSTSIDWGFIAVTVCVRASAA